MSAEVFANLSKIQRINLQDTDIDKLPSNFFTSGNIGTLVDGGVEVTGFIYCNDPPPDFKSKLGPSQEITPHDDRGYTQLFGLPAMKRDYCYTE